MVAPKLPNFTPQQIAEIIRGVARSAEGKITTADLLTLNYMADLVEAGAEVVA